MALAKPVRGLLVLAVILWCMFLYQILLRKAPEIEQPHDDSYYERDPNLDLTDEPEGTLVRASDAYGVSDEKTDRINATILALVKNDEVDGMVASMRDLERTWNSKFNYPWTFFNDEPFTKEFKEKTSAATKAKCIYEQIPEEHWAMPSWIDDQIYEESAHVLKESGVQYGNTSSYHRMCRWNSGFFYKHPALEHRQYYWRVEPNVKFFCDVDYDVFRYMQDNNKTYGFTINLYDDPKTLPSLWPETVKFIAEHPDYLHEESAIKWLTDDIKRPDHNRKAQGYSTCHFWSNFEIGDLNFWRSKPYEEYFNHLDRAGGFFYERWGDAPVHSIALGLFEDRSKLHWFRDIGYAHSPFLQCPNSAKCSGCVPGKFTDGESWLKEDDCRPNWFRYVGFD